MSSEISEAVAVLGGSLALSLIFDRDARAACAAAAAGGPAHSIHAHSHIFDGFQFWWHRACSWAAEMEQGLHE